MGYGLELILWQKILISSVETEEPREKPLQAKLRPHFWLVKPRLSYCLKVQWWKDNIKKFARHKRASFLWPQSFFYKNAHETLSLTTSTTDEDRSLSLTKSKTNVIKLFSVMV